MALPPPDPGATVLITGASAGIGEEFARQFAARGYGVALVARRAERLRALAGELLAQHGVRAEVLPCDLLEADARAELPERLDEAGLRVDVLVNNAGFGTGGPFHESDLERELQQVRILCEAYVHLTGLFLPGMVERRSGAIVNVASTAALQPLPNSAGYGAAKAHALSFSEAVHTEARRHGVTVTALCPGPVETEFFEVSADSPIESAIPRFAWVSVEDVVRAGIDGVERNKRVVIPGLYIRAAAPFSRLSPRMVQLRVFDRLFQR